MGQTYKEGCSLDTTRVLCCKPHGSNFAITALNRKLNYNLTAGCNIWTNKCYGTGYGGNSVCQMEFGYNYLASGQERSCENAILGFKYECCPI